MTNGKLLQVVFLCDRNNLHQVPQSKGAHLVTQVRVNLRQAHVLLGFHDICVVCLIVVYGEAELNTGHPEEVITVTLTTPHGRCLTRLILYSDLFTIHIIIDCIETFAKVAKEVFVHVVVD